LSGSDVGRQAVLAAIATATKRGADVAIRPDAASGVITIDDGVRPPLALLQIDDISDTGIWQFDETPTGPVGSVPRWSGFLARIQPGGEVSVVRMEGPTLPTTWAKIADWIADPAALARLIARYAGRDAGLPVHHTVVTSADEFRALVAESEREQLDLDVVRPPTLVRDGPPDFESHLSFLSSFLETSRPGMSTPNGLGIARWTATWGLDHPLDLSAGIVLRGIPSIYTG
jgi:hypothetical protein